MCRENSISACGENHKYEVWSLPMTLALICESKWISIMRQKKYITAFHIQWQAGSHEKKIGGKFRFYVHQHSLIRVLISIVWFYISLVWVLVSLSDFSDHFILMQNVLGWFLRSNFSEATFLFWVLCSYFVPIPSL